MTVLPVSPDNIKRKPLPDFVITAFNEMLEEKWDGREVTIMQDKAIQKVIDVSARGDYRNMVSRDAIFDNRWLDIEDTYRQNGWTVMYDKPGYCETYQAYWKFNKRK